MFVCSLTFWTTYAHINMHTNIYARRNTHSPPVGMQPYECSLWPAGWKVSFSHWELCQFSFHYSTWGLNPHYHNKLYFYRHVQTEAAFQGIRLNFTWPPVFLGNTVLPQMTPSFPQFLLHMEHAAYWISYFFCKGCIAIVIVHSVYTHHR